MASTKEIQKRMRSIKDTMKITNAMYMISSSKLRGAKERLEETEPYFYLLRASFSRVLRHIPQSDSIYIHPKNNKRDEEIQRGYIVITADKGMAGAYNHNVIKVAHALFEQNPTNNHLFVVGELGRHYFEKEGLDVDTQFHYTVQNPTLSRARTISERVHDLYKQDKLDEIYIIYTRMVNAMSMDVELVRLLPLHKEAYVEKREGIYPEDWAAFPSWTHLLNHMVPNYMSGVIYGALVESYASEQTARMTAMESATKSAKDMLQLLMVEFNRIRQAVITQELTEVVSGAKAQKRKKKH